MIEQLQHASAALETACLDTGTSEKADGSSPKLTAARGSTAQKRDQPEDSKSAPPSVKRGRGRPRKHHIVDKEGMPAAAAPKPTLSLFKEALEPPRKEPRVGERKSERIQDIQQREEEEREDRMMAEDKTIIPLYKPPTKYKLWDMQQTRTLLMHDLTKMPPPHYGHFGDTLGFKGGNFIYAQNKRTYEARVELASTGDLEIDESLDTDREDEEDKTADKDGEDGDWKKDYEKWLNDPNE